MSERWLTCDPPGWALLLSYLDVILETDFVCHHRRPIVAITFILAHRQAVVSSGKTSHITIASSETLLLHAQSALLQLSLLVLS